MKADVVTSDPSLQVQQILHDAYGERFRIPAPLNQRVAAVHAGGRGRSGSIAATRDQSQGSFHA